MCSLSRIVTSAALAASLLLASGAQAAEYALFVHETPAEFAKRARTDAVGAAYWNAYAEFGAALQRAGVLRGGGALAEPAAGRSVGATAGARTDLVLGGWFVIDVENLDAALDWARRAPAAATGAVEVRPLQSSPAMR